MNIFFLLSVLYNGILVVIKYHLCVEVSLSKDLTNYMHYVFFNNIWHSNSEVLIYISIIEFKNWLNERTYLKGDVDKIVTAISCDISAYIMRSSDESALLDKIKNTAIEVGGKKGNLDFLHFLLSFLCFHKKWF